MALPLKGIASSVGDLSGPADMSTTRDSMYAKSLGNLDDKSLIDFVAGVIEPCVGRDKRRMVLSGLSARWTRKDPISAGDMDGFSDPAPLAIAAPGPAIPNTNKIGTFVPETTNGREEPRSRYACSDVHCPYAAGQKDGLDKHENRCHGNPLKHKCPMCTYSVSRENNLVRHLELHQKANVAGTLLARLQPGHKRRKSAAPSHSHPTGIRTAQKKKGKRHRTLKVAKERPSAQPMWRSGGISRDQNDGARASSRLIFRSSTPYPRSRHSFLCCHEPGCYFKTSYEKGLKVHHTKKHGAEPNPSHSSEAAVLNTANGYKKRKSPLMVLEALAPGSARESEIDVDDLSPLFSPSLMDYDSEEERAGSSSGYKSDSGLEAPTDHDYSKPHNVPVIEQESPQNRISAAELKSLHDQILASGNESKKKKRIPWWCADLMKQQDSAGKGALVDDETEDDDMDGWPRLGLAMISTTTDLLPPCWLSYI